MSLILSLYFLSEETNPTIFPDALISPAAPDALVPTPKELNLEFWVVLVNVVALLALPELVA